MVTDEEKDEARSWRKYEKRADNEHLFEVCERKQEKKWSQVSLLDETGYKCKILIIFSVNKNLSTD